MHFQDSPIIAVDFETYYTSEYSLSSMSTWAYVHDPKFDAYLVAVHGETERFVGHPSKFDWRKLTGATVVMHNASFDELVFQRLKETGVIPADVIPARVLCTADLAAWMGCKRDLKTAAKELLGIEVSKAVRTNMKGRTYTDAVAAGMEADLLAYGGSDAELCYKLAVKFLPEWPEKEQELSCLNREAGLYGVAIDTELVESSIRTLKVALHEAQAKIPWADEHPVLSPAACRRQGREDGIPVPASLAKDDPKVIEWAEKYGPEHPWIMAMREWRSANMVLKRVEAVRDNIRPDGTMPYQMRYGGAHTMRMSGGGDSGGKFNMQNMPRKPMAGVDVRALFIARPGHVLMLPDFAQIEARVLLWRAGDTRMLDLIEQEGNLYQAYAKAAGTYSGSDLKKENAALYQLSKAQCLGLGYGCGHVKFRALAKAQYGIDMTLDESKESVDTYRTTYPKVVAYWRAHHQWLQFSATHADPTHEVKLASGRVQTYFRPRFVDGQIVAETVRGLPARKLYGGLLTENEIQATARDIFCDAWLAVVRAGHRVLWTMHDELIIELPEDRAAESAPEIVRLMKTSSPWAKGCPIDVEYVISKHYRK